MAKTRMINTRFWNDGFIVQLNPLDRYLFLYFLTNEHTNIAGVYELPLRTMATETGIDRDMLPKMLRRLKGKIFYIDGWVYIKNFQKHQTTTSEKVQRGIEIELSKIPAQIKDKIADLDKKLYPQHRVSNPIIYSDSDSNSNLNSDSDSYEDTAQTPRSNAQRFFLMVDENSNDLTQFIAKLVEKYGSNHEYFMLEIKKFKNYWTELSPSGKKQKWEMQKTFEVQRRLATWLSRAPNFSKFGGVKKVEIIR